MPGFTAHQVVALPLWAYMSYLGIKYFYLSNDDDYDTPYNRGLKPHPAGIEVAEIAFGMQLIWNTPIGLITPGLGDPVILLHHLGMILCAGIMGGLFGSSLGSYHALFYMGVTEISSIPLIVIELFHPKRMPWYQYFKEKDSSSFIHKIYEVCKVIFALSFLIVRGILFPYEVLCHCVPDCLYAISLPEEERNGTSNTEIYFLMISSFLFAFLQLHWATLVIRKSIESVYGGKAKKKKD